MERGVLVYSVEFDILLYKLIVPKPEVIELIKLTFQEFLV